MKNVVEKRYFIRNSYIFSKRLFISKITKSSIVMLFMVSKEKKNVLASKEVEDMCFVDKIKHKMYLSYQTIN